jgi:hypothetical protein
VATVKHKILSILNTAYQLKDKEDFEGHWKGSEKLLLAQTQPCFVGLVIRGASAIKFL